MTSCDHFLARGCRALGLDLNVAQRADLCRYYRELDKWSKKMNLVARAPMAEILTSHFLDSLTLLPHLPSGAFRLLDVGSGAGFPGLVLKTVCPAMQLTLVEPRAKRVSFLRHIIRTLGLADSQVVAERLRQDDPDQQEALGFFEVVTSRALASLEDFLPLAEPYCAATGQVICMKGPRAEAEYEAWLATRGRSSLEKVATGHYILPASDRGRHLLIFSRK